MASKELFSCNSPLYSVHCLGKGEFYVAGGGGQARTGVPNVLEIHKLTHNGLDFIAECVHHHEWDKELIMNSSCHPKAPYTIAAGVEGSCYLLSLRAGEEREREEEEKEGDEGEREEGEKEGEEGEREEGEEGEREEREKQGEEGEREEREKQGEEGEREEGEKEGEDEGIERDSDRKYTVKLMASTQTDFSSEPYQKVVRFSRDGSLVVTGGEDGIIRSWKYPGLEEVNTFSTEEPQKKEIEDLDCHPYKPELVSASRGGEARVWDLDMAELKNTFYWPQGKQPTYRFRGCRFSPAEGEPVHLYTINIPIKTIRQSRQYCYVIKWSTDTWQPIISQRTGREPLSAMTIDSSSNFIGVGNGEGGIAIYNTSLKLLTTVSRVHNLFVTGLAFVPVQTQASSQKPVLVSVSADRCCYVTTIGRKKGMQSVLLFFILVPLLILFIALVIQRSMY